MFSIAGGGDKTGAVSTSYTSSFHSVKKRKIEVSDMGPNAIPSTSGMQFQAPAALATTNSETPSTSVTNDSADLLDTDDMVVELEQNGTNNLSSSHDAVPSTSDNYHYIIIMQDCLVLHQHWTLHVFQYM